MYLNRHLTKEDIWMKNKHMKSKHFTSWFIRKSKVKKNQDDI